MKASDATKVAELARDREGIRTRLAQARLGLIRVSVGGNEGWTGYTLTDKHLAEVIQDDVVASLRKQLIPIEAQLLALGVVLD